MIPKQCVIFCGGRGERLGELTANCPKPLLPINGKPFLDYIIMSFYSRFEIDSFILLAGYLGQQISEAYNGWGTFRHLKISTFVEQQPLGTALALKSLQDCLDTEFILANGDTYTLMPREPIEAPLHGLLVRNIRLQTSRGLLDCGVRKCSFRLLDWIYQNDLPGMKLEEIIESRLKWSDKQWYNGHESFIDIGTPDEYKRAQNIFR